jgi:hypothetical protein
MRDLFRCCRLFKLNCHFLTLSLRTSVNVPTGSMPAAVRLHYILCARDLIILAFGLGLCRWSANCGRLLVVYDRIDRISGPLLGRRSTELGPWHEMKSRGIA